MDRIKLPPNERITRVERYGRVYRRKMPSTRNMRTDGPPGHRWCTQCADFKPLDAFYTFPKRYICRRHHWLRVRKSQQEAALRNVEIKGLRDFIRQSIMRLKKGCSVLGYERCPLDRPDVQGLITKAGVPLSLFPTPCPIDPCMPMWPSNIGLVSAPCFDLLMTMYQATNSRALFVGMAQRCNLLPSNYDVSRPDDPFHDPNFVRPAHNLAELFADEEPKLPLSMDLLLVRELEAASKTPVVEEDSILSDLQQIQAYEIAARSALQACCVWRNSKRASCPEKMVLLERPVQPAIYKPTCMDMWYNLNVEKAFPTFCRIKPSVKEEPK